MAEKPQRRESDEVLAELVNDTRVIKETLLGELGANGKKGLVTNFWLLVDRVKNLEGWKKYTIGIETSIFIAVVVMLVKGFWNA